MKDKKTYVKEINEFMQDMNVQQCSHILAFVKLLYRKGREKQRRTIQQ